MRKTVTISLLLGLVLVFAAVPALAYEGPAPYTTPDGVFMVPLRWVVEANGADILSGADGQVVVFARKTEQPVLDEFGDVIKLGKTYERITVFREGEAKAIVSGVEVPMPASAEVREGRLFVPVQFALIACRI